MKPNTPLTRILLLFVAAVTIGATVFMTLDVLVYPRPGVGVTGPAPEPLWPVPAFTMLDQDGRTVRHTDLVGEVWVVGFFFTSCPLVCPQMTLRLADFQRELQALGKEAAGVKLVSMSIDPATDRPQRLKEFAAGYGAEPGRWFFLTHPEGDRDAVWSMVGVQGFKMTVTDTPHDPLNPIEHSPRFLLIDRQGMVRETYDSRDDEDMARLLRDSRAVIAEKTPPTAP